LRKVRVKLLTPSTSVSPLAQAVDPTEIFTASPDRPTPRLPAGAAPDGIVNSTEEEEAVVTVLI
jgi:hypothetical protein